MVPGRKQGDAAVVKHGICIIAWMSWASVAWAQELPAEEVQVNLNSYFDNFQVNIVYPTVSMTKHVSETTSITGRYLVDVISAASMKSRFEVDGVTSASGRRHGGEEGGFDEVRHEAGLGVTRILGNTTVSLNGLYSTEHDYTSRTLAASISQPFAKQNTILTLGLVRSWDDVFPDTRSWRKNKDVVTLSAGLTQILNKRLLMQVDASYADNRGYLSDAYQVVSVFEGNNLATFEPVHPGERVRKAVGVRAKYKVAHNAAWQWGYRYYWDDWDVTSHTLSTHYQHRLRSGMQLSTGLRTYFQSRAFFFEPRYTSLATFMTVDSKLDKGYSTELQLEATFGGEAMQRIPLVRMFTSDKMELSVKLNYYRRHTETPDWHSRYKTLHAYIFSVGYRYRF